MKCLKIGVKLNRLPAYAVSQKDGRITFELEALDGKLTCNVYYSAKNGPLQMESDIKEGDSVEIVLLPYRIELHINGVLKDENWPLEGLMLCLGDEMYGSVQPTLSESEFNEPVLPSIIGEFRNAEGWRPEDNVFVGDCMPYSRNGEYHILYLKDRHHHRSKWGYGAHQWEHISTKDFETWSIHPMAVPITDPDEGSICTGSWISHNGKEYLYYTVRKAGGRPAPIQRSVSEDGYHFVKDESFGFTLPSRYLSASARDPKVIKSTDGLFHMFVTTTLTETGKGCLAHYVSEDLDHWTDFGEPIYTSDTEDEPECPDYFEYNGRYYLIYSLRGSAHYSYSDEPLSGWKTPKNPIIPCESVPKAAPWGDKLVFSGFKRIDGYAGNMTFRTAWADENGELVFE